MSASSLKQDECQLGMRVQDYWGRVATVRWLGKIEKKDAAPDKITGHYVGIEYDDSSKNPNRGNGTWGKRTYFECDATKGLLVKASDIFKEMNTEGIKTLRAEFGDRVKDWHDFELVKFCIARKFEMAKVIEMLDKHLKWREEFQPSAEEYFNPKMVEDYPAGYTGTTDHDENIIYCERPGNGGKCYPSDFVHRYTLPVIARWHACGVEMARNIFRKTDYEHKRVCYVIDLKGVNSMTRPMIGFAQTLATVEQDNYPENLGRVFIVNCPYFFRLAWKLVKMFIDDRTNKKIKFVAPNHAVKELKEVMPEEEIPDFCGGTSNKWMQTNGGHLGSDDPSKEHKIDAEHDEFAKLDAQVQNDDGDDAFNSEMAGSPSGEYLESSQQLTGSQAASPTESQASPVSAKPPQASKASSNSKPASPSSPKASSEVDKASIKSTSKK